MKKAITSNSFHHDCDPNMLLEQLDSFIKSLAQKQVPRNAVFTDSLYDRIDELTQRIRLKFNEQLQKRDITNPKAYLYSIARTEAVNMVREHRQMLPLPESEEGEGQLSNAMSMVSEDMQDPAEILVRKEAEGEQIATLVKETDELFPVQQNALLHQLKERIEDVLPLVDALKDVGIDVEMASQPDDEKVASSRTSLSIVRKKLRAALKNIEK
jgi:DNA-directed RNA polymerase specialized sigma24 family protein